MRVNKVGLIVAGIVNCGLSIYMMDNGKPDVALITLGLMLFNMGLFLNNEDGEWA